MSLEKIIRPFESGDVFTARTIAPRSVPSVTPQADIDVTWGDGNSGDYSKYALQGLIGGTVIYTEKSRVTSKVRVTNPEDDSQFVDVERIDKLVMASDKGDEIHFNLNNP